MESNRLISRFRNSIASQSYRRGLTLAIPFLIMGSFSLLFTNFPNDSYQIFIKKFLDGSVIALLDTLYDISLGSLALILCVTPRRFFPRPFWIPSCSGRLRLRLSFVIALCLVSLKSHNRKIAYVALSLHNISICQDEGQYN